MIEIFRPDIYAKSVFDINYDNLKKKHIKCILFDLDNTLVPVNTKKPDKRIKDFINDLKEKGFKVIILSNSKKEKVVNFRNSLEVDASAFSLKPRKKKYIKIMNTFNYKPEEIAAVGDQLLTDVLGANRVGIISILVNPVSKKDEFITLFNRSIERIVYKALERKDLLKKGKYYE